MSRRSARQAEEREAPRVRLAPLGFAVAGYTRGSDDVRVGPDSFVTPGEAEQSVRDYVALGPIPPGVRLYVVALTPVTEITAQEGPQ